MLHASYRLRKAKLILANLPYGGQFVRLFSVNSPVHRGLLAKASKKKKTQKQRFNLKGENSLHSSGIDISEITTKDIRKKVPRSVEEDEHHNDDSTESIINDLISESRPITYYDPANTTLDLRLPNDVLVQGILHGVEERMGKRFEVPSKDWLRGYIELSQNKYNKNVTTLTSDFSNSIKDATMSIAKVNNGIRVGDIVTLEAESARVYLIVSEPEELGQNAYTYINNEGEIIFGPKNLIKTRIPSVVPEHLVDIVRLLIRLEVKHMDISPIGVPDGSFSRSVKSLPKELQNSSSLKGKEEEESTFGSHIASPEVGDDFFVSSASAQLLMNSNVNTYMVPNKARDLISQPLAQLSIKTFDKLPSILAKLEILHRVLQYSEDGDIVDSPRTFSMFQIMSFLEHIPLEPIENATYFEKSRFYKKLLRQLFSPFLTTTIGRLSSLGKPFPVNKETSDFFKEEYTISTFLALVLSLQKQGRLWKVNQQASTKVPTSVDVLPTSNVNILERTIFHMSSHINRDKFAQFFISKLKGKKNYELPELYHSTIQLFKDYIADNFSNDPVSGTSVTNIIRSIDAALQAEGLYEPPVAARSYEFSKTRAFEILQMLDMASEVESSSWRNPASWSYSLLIPHKNTSAMSDFSLDYYECLDKAFEVPSKLEDYLKKSESSSGPDTISKLGEYNDIIELNDKGNSMIPDFYSTDPFASIRKSFGDIPVYCIDSETAHEIDDGISIQEDKTDNSYIVSIHIANPTSFIKPFSNLSKIAFNKGFTTYFPEGPTMMFPKIIAKIAGLGEQELGSRTFAFQYKVSKNLIDDYITKRNENEDFRPSIKTSTKILKQIDDSATINLFNVHNFPKSYTYAKVNEILNDPQNVEDFKNGRVKTDHVENLFKLHSLSTIIQDIRLQVGGGLVFGSSQSSVLIDHIDTSEGKPETERFEILDNDAGYNLQVDNDNTKGNQIPVIKIITNENQGANSKSQLLVSQLMISGNYAASVFAAKQKIPIIHRIQEMNLHESVLKTIEKMLRDRYLKGEDFSVEERSHIISILSAATYLVEKKPHDSIGLSSYATVTSPLRRFVDMINHWKLEQYFLSRQGNENIDLASIRDDHLYYIGSHLQMRELIGKKLQRFSNKFWQGVFLQEYLKLLDRGKIDKPIEFRMLVKSDPKLGDVIVEIVNFEALSARIESSPELIEDGKRGLVKVGAVISGQFKVKKLDYIEDELVFQYCK